MEQSHLLHSYVCVVSYQRPNGNDSLLRLSQYLHLLVSVMVRSRHKVIHLLPQQVKPSLWVGDVGGSDRFTQKITDQAPGVSTGAAVWTVTWRQCAVETT